jgi:hypothetical protein
MSTIRWIWAEIRYWCQSAGYSIRPYDMLADNRRWFWQKRQPCGREIYHQHQQRIAQIPDHELGAEIQRVGAGLKADIAAMREQIKAQALQRNTSSTTETVAPQQDRTEQ